VIRREGGRIVLSGPVTLSNVGRVLEDGRQHFAEGVQAVDIGEVTELDSALVALLLAWLRDARAAGRELVIENPPQALRTIARLYGVDELLPVSGSAAPEAARHPAAPAH
jgi:phospholipid transport system transporter-binding protein